MSKSTIRQEMLKQRNNVSVTERLLKGHQAADLFSHFDLFYQFNRIACYLATPKEFNCHPLIDYIWLNQKECYLPTLPTDTNGVMQFKKYEHDTQLSPNQFNILEPQNKEILPAHLLEIVLLPLVAFDVKGNRIGMGGGYYDRTFDFIKNLTRRKPLLLGLAYEFQKVPAIIPDEWDLQLDGAVTEKEIYFFNT